MLVCAFVLSFRATGPKFRTKQAKSMTNSRSSPGLVGPGGVDKFGFSEEAYSGFDGNVVRLILASTARVGFEAQLHDVVRCLRGFKASGLLDPGPRGVPAAKLVALAVTQLQKTLALTPAERGKQAQLRATAQREGAHYQDTGDWDFRGGGGGGGESGGGESGGGGGGGGGGGNARHQNLAMSVASGSVPNCSPPPPTNG
jgi:hypothetical protein